MLKWRFETAGHLHHSRAHCKLHMLVYDPHMGKSTLLCSFPCAKVLPTLSLSQYSPVCHLTLCCRYNRDRQASITTSLVEIISGAAALVDE